MIPFNKTYRTGLLIEMAEAQQDSIIDILKSVKS